MWESWVECPARWVSRCRPELRATEIFIMLIGLRKSIQRAV